MLGFNKRIGIDLGTANSLVYLEGKGVVLNEPTVVAVDEDSKVVAVGNEAREMLGRTPEGITASRPLRDGVIADYVITESMLKYFIDKVCGRSRIFKPEVMICVPAGVTSVERRAVIDATLSAGAKTAYLIDEPLAAAIGAKIPIALPSGNMIVDIGGGSTEAAVISLGGVVVHNSVRVGGNRIDEAITTYLKRSHNLIIGERSAEEIKINIGSAIAVQERNNTEVRGRDSITGLPRVMEISSQEVAEAIALPLNQIVEAIKGVLEQTPPELASDIIEKGIVMSGGTSLLRNLDKLFTQITGVPCHVAENPLFCVVNGTGLALENIDIYKRSLNRR
ncbi:MAG: rod shape-determining protein [Candidatus Woykebacteria bacterium RIFCSPHIGHO2_12_FULL_43_10]|uniref:Cell shape-determining protein MreB n=2 Tax=Candidatus Woykeibacteriota TaxID=1817899 RepID=A0A1G1WZT5_9BACT|nr:MAG: rod shape-determining protein [Candidatus Woykebacteria bacterium RIFCSPHIGHO2_01_FULL_43_29]OGY29424.1 MAG: rod shape-determining protein [Candidatus Woykebacteria bacterium RIFCSPHIGHO2_02_FULL_43_16b]OGY29454.1 MAG: rod shape-determining protein [Candidatus Woykebacteria bacterium RIFCSPHIGHO2_12_FULL_43_10]OGY32647.1 MAG: rod shape-determining protein [Candidatus Woykebacteria bacterium RIFCSPLOWO2_01_FULL_43_14]